MLVSHIISAVHSTDRRLHFLFFTESFHGWPLSGWLLLFLTFSCLVYKVTFPSAVTMGVHVVGIVAVIVFYLLILGVGLWAARKSRGETDSENVMLAGRNIGILVGVFTMTGQCLWRSRTILFVSKTVAWSIQIVAGSIQRCRVQQSERLPKFPIPATQFLVSACSVEQAYGCVFYTAFFKEILLLKHSLINVPINLTTDLSWLLLDGQSCILSPV